VVTAVHGVVHRVHAIEGRRYALHPHLIPEVEGAAPWPQQVAREGQPARVAAIAPRYARVVGRYERLVIGLVYNGFVGCGRDGVRAAVTERVGGSHAPGYC
jgi:hypothetical protein